MALLTIQHTVENYRVWRSVYDSLEELQDEWGVIDASVHRLACTPNVVLVLRYFATVAQAQGFLTSREIDAAMQRAGVVGPSRVEIYA